MKRKEFKISTKGMTLEEWVQRGGCGFSFYLN